MIFFFFQAEDGIRDLTVTGVQTCALPILSWSEYQSLKRTSSPASSVPWKRLMNDTWSPSEPWIVGKDRKSTRLNSSHSQISYAVFCLKKKRVDAFDRGPARKD